MPNHIHLLWEMLEMNGKEMPHASFLKFTAHSFKEELKSNHPEILSKFNVNEIDRTYRFWQRDALAIKVDDKTIAEQKLFYIHHNPLQDHWNLSTKPEDYYWSSAAFYEKDQYHFNFLTHYHQKF
ncbi:hypothetical protein BH23BAC1_BH23BAC1_21850 [soil metagenome]